MNEAKEFDSYRVYYAGEEVFGAPLEQILEQEQGGKGGRSIGWTFIYGDCTPPSGDGGCAPPLQIQNYSSCRRWAGIYPGKPHLFDFRGTKAARAAGGLEIYTGHTTVVIFANHRSIARSAARRLGDVRDAERPALLPPAAPGSLRGELPCQRDKSQGVVPDA